MTPSMVAAASHVVLHFFHAVGGLDGDATGVEGDGFADEADHWRAGFQVRGRISDDHDAGSARDCPGRR